MSPTEILKENSVPEVDITTSESSYIRENNQIFEDWGEWLRLSLSGGAILRYSICVKKMLGHLDKPIRDISYSDLVRHINWRNEQQRGKWGRDLSKGTLNGITAALRKFWKYLSLPHVRIVENNIAIHLEHKKIRSMGVDSDKILTIQEIKSLLEVSQEKPRDFALLSTFYYSGIRRSELQFLKWENINFKDRYITIEHGKGDKKRNVTLNINLAKVLEDFQEKTGDETGYIFKSREGNHLSRHTIAWICSKYSAKAKITKKFHPHMLRHSHATHRLENGDNIKNVQQDLGHESISITLDLYYHPSKQERERGIDNHLPSFLGSA